MQTADSKKTNVFLYHTHAVGKLSLMAEQDANIVTVAYSGYLTDRTKLLCFEDRKGREIYLFLFLIVTLCLCLFPFSVPLTHMNTEVLMGLLNSALMSPTPSQDSFMKPYSKLARK